MTFLGTLRDASGRLLLHLHQQIIFPLVLNIPNIDATLLFFIRILHVVWNSHLGVNKS